MFVPGRLFQPIKIFRPVPNFTKKKIFAIYLTLLTNKLGCFFMASINTALIFLVKLTSEWGAPLGKAPAFDTNIKI